MILCFKLIILLTLQMGFAGLPATQVTSDTLDLTTLFPLTNDPKPIRVPGIRRLLIETTA